MLHRMTVEAPIAPGAQSSGRSLRGTRDAIRAAAARFFAEQGYHGTSLSGIADEVGIQKASIFHYFASKEALYAAVIEDGHGRAEEVVRTALATTGGWLARVRALLDAYVDLVAAHPSQTRILLRQSLGDAPPGYARRRADRLLSIVTDFLAAGRRAGAFAPVDGPSLVLGVVGMVTFFFTSAPVVAPRWSAAVSREQQIARLRRHVTTVVLRTLAPGAEEVRHDDAGGRYGESAE